MTVQETKVIYTISIAFLKDNGDNDKAGTNLAGLGYGLDATTDMQVSPSRPPCQIVPSLYSS